MSGVYVNSRNAEQRRLIALALLAEKLRWLDLQLLDVLRRAA